MSHATDLVSEDSRSEQSLSEGMAIVNDYLDTLREIRLTPEEKKASLDLLREISGNVARTDEVHAKATAEPYKALAGAFQEAMARAESPAERREILDKVLTALEATQERIEAQNQRTHDTQRGGMRLAALLAGGVTLLAVLTRGVQPRGRI